MKRKLYVNKAHIEEAINNDQFNQNSGTVCIIYEYDTKVVSYMIQTLQIYCRFKLKKLYNFVILRALPVIIDSFCIRGFL